MKKVIVIPTYNEKENIEILIPQIFKLLPNISVIVADDNSSDSTASIVTEFKKEYSNITLVSRKEKDGLARAYINVFLQIINDKDIESVILMDADFSPQLKYLPEMIEKSKDYGVVIGSRHALGSKMIGSKLPRRVLSFFGNLYYKMILRMPIHDYSCDYMVISIDLMRKIDLSKIGAKGYAFVPELKYLLYKAGATFFEVPIIFIERIEGKSKISIKIILEGVINPWKIVFRK